MTMYTPVTVISLNMYTNHNILSIRKLRMNRQHVLGTIGRRAPFHSQIQNRATTKNPENSGASTAAEVHGKVTPPYRTSPSVMNRWKAGKSVLTQLSGSITNVHPISVSIAPT